MNEEDRIFLVDLECLLAESERRDSLAVTVELFLPPNQDRHRCFSDGISLLAEHLNAVHRFEAYPLRVEAAIIEEVQRNYWAGSKPLHCILGMEWFLAVSIPPGCFHWKLVSVPEFVELYGIKCYPDHRCTEGCQVVLKSADAYGRWLSDKKQRKART